MKRSILLAAIFGCLSLFAAQPTLTYDYELEDDHYNINCTLVGRESETNTVVFSASTNGVPIKMDFVVCPPATNFPTVKWKMAPGTTNFVWYFRKDDTNRTELTDLNISAVLDSITIRFDCEDGTLSETNKTYVLDSLMDEFPVVTPEKCKFGGWYTQKVGGNEITTNTIATSLYSELYAHLGVDVIFYPRIASVPCYTNSYQVNYLYNNISNVNAKGYTFIGWYTDPVNGYKISNGDTVSAHVNKLYAHYVEYLVVDISSGPNAERYPFSFLTECPIESISEDGTITNREWTSEYKTNKIVLRKIESGTYNVQSLYYTTPANRYPRPKRTYTVTISESFYMGIFQITQKQWQLVMGDKPSYFNNSKYYATRPVERLSWSDIRQTTNDTYSGQWPNGEPASESFLGKLCSKVKLSAASITSAFKFDLPTENEWEYCCRAGTETDFNNGIDSEGEPQDANMNLLGRYYYNSKVAYQKCSPKYGTAIVGSYYPNDWDLYDMHGNVFEWCLDYYQLEFMTNSLVDPVGPATGTNRVIRGGSWKYMAYDCTSPARYYFDPTNKTNSTGFRIKARSNSN